MREVRSLRPYRREKRRLSPKGKKERREGRMKDALALGGEEGRDKLRKVAASGKCATTRKYPNGGTRNGVTVTH